MKKDLFTLLEFAGWFILGMATLIHIVVLNSKPY